MQVTDQKFREDLKSVILEKFDGDYNVLWSKSPAGSQFDELNLHDPLMQIAMPSLTSLTADDWEVSHEIPLVVYRPPDVDLNEVTSLKAFREGVEVSLDITEEPDELILVVSHNERVLTTPVSVKPDVLKDRICLVEPVLQDENFDYYLKSEINDCQISGYSPGTGSSSGCNRDQYDRRDHVTRAKFASINIFRQAEHYLDGNPEVFFIITLGSKNPSGFSSLRKSFVSNDRSQWKDCGLFSCSTEWHDKTLPIFNWDRTVFGDLVRYDWFEEDYSKAKIDLTLGLSTKISDVSVSGGVKITINEKDYFLDQDFVEYCDQANGLGTTYNTGKLLFTINQQ
jgi:hypothetical protein